MPAFALAGQRLPAPAAKAPFSSSSCRSQRAQPQRARSVQARGVPVEFAQLAGEGAFISGVAGTMISMTLIGLAVGFVLLRFESLVEEGKI